MSMPSADLSEVPTPKTSDLQLRQRLFWTILSLALAALVLSHLTQWLLSRPLCQLDSTTGALISVGIPNHQFGASGFYLAKFLPRRANHRMVVLLGNSVYQPTFAKEPLSVVQRMQAHADSNQQRIDFYNGALAGSGMHDHLVQLAKVVKHHPDLVVVSFINLAFTADARGKKDVLPRFRTDCNQMAFDPDALAVLPRSFYTREFNLDTACSSITSTLLPLKRLDFSLRLQVNRHLWRTRLGSWFQQATEETSDAPPRNGPSRPYPETAELLQEFIEVARAHQVPVLFLRQESGPAWATPDVLPAVRAACACYDKAFVVDLSSHYRPDLYPDDVHPTAEGREPCAWRHYCAVVEMLARLQRSK